MGDVWVKGSKELCTHCQEYVHLGDKRNHEQSKKHKLNVQRKLDQAMLKLGVSKRSKIDVSQYGMGLKDTKWSQPVSLPAPQPVSLPVPQPVFQSGSTQQPKEVFQIKEKVVQVDDTADTNVQFKKRKVKAARK
jgi:hypothetical protein